MSRLSVQSIERGVFADIDTVRHAARDRIDYYRGCSQEWQTTGHVRQLEEVRAVIGDVLYASFPSDETRVLAGLVEQHGTAALLRELADALDWKS